METSVAIRGRGITKCFGDVVALDRIDLNVPHGQIHGLVGPNGAGKTTLLGLLLGLAVADEGRLEILGTPVGRALAAPDGVAGFVDGPGLYPTLTARQNLAALAALRRRDARAAGAGDVADVLDQVGLTEVADDKVRGFSLGMRQRLGLAAALLSKPRLLVLDEPSNGLDPAGKKHVRGVLGRLAADGTTVILSSHRMDDLEALCSEVTILATGRVVFSGPLSKLSAENSELDYRLRTSDPQAARTVALETSGISVIEGSDAVNRHDTEVLVVRAQVPALDELVARLVRADVAVRELAPVISPLEAAFLALTEHEQTAQEETAHEETAREDEADR
ncbi:MAG TPA: ATP-binding cassette domain-containing protein [Actinocrinis sp.]|uniref:ABC transporter ATP-binding protein n=1 Tax=Actinocrinis sp. TaxID=1920516 RepID=UPI002D466542|nr:ATP-binding cassette domain-containing protein [Actinocrinis sp.]HZU54920.1 ATP-binding cassette domain-containing protein [Actinocrinis sp.]